MEFKLKSKYKPTGDQPQAIESLVNGVNDGLTSQVLLGVTGSGKTFTMANVIAKTGRPTLILAHNKTLAAQLCNEMRELFPENRVEFFVSYYDYYQPESYIVSTDTYIEKDMSINDEIDKLRHSATCSLMERDDVIIVSSVSCIYGLGAPEMYSSMCASIRPGDKMSREDLIKRLISIQYERATEDFDRCKFRVRGDVVEIFPSWSSELAVRVEFFGDEVEAVSEVNVVSGRVISKLSHAFITPASHFVTSKDRMDKALKQIEADLETRLEELNKEGKQLEAYRLKQRVNYDIEMLREMGYCNGIENYSRYFDGRKPGEAPYTLLDYFPKDFLLIVDESHMTIPQIRAMYNGDKARKTNLVDYGFRLPSAFDNRPLNFDEFNKKINQTIYVSATPADYEMKLAGNVAEQIIRPTGLLDPLVDVRPIEGQIDDLIGEINMATKSSGKVLVTTLTKKMAEKLTDYLTDFGIKVKYLHSEIDTLERINIINGLRRGEFDVLVGINLLREGLDLPEVKLVAILDADKEGFLRSSSSLIQIIGRAARNAESKVIMYADNITDSMKYALDETSRRREIQMEYNRQHGITPKTIIKEVKNTLEITSKPASDKNLSKSEIYAEIEKIKVLMQIAAKELKFEDAIELREEMAKLKKLIKD